MKHTMGLFKYIPIPREHHRDIYQIDYEKLKDQGFKCILFDYDFTLAPWKQGISFDTVKLFKKLHDMGFIVAVATNASKERAKDVLKLMNGEVKVFDRLKKPFTKKLKYAITQLGCEPKDVVIIGDLFITDILAGNKLGMYTILVNPYIYDIDSFFKKLSAFTVRVGYWSFFYTFGWIFKLLLSGIPTEIKENIFEVDYEKLKENGYKMIFFDFDNTLSPRKEMELDKRTIELLKKLSKDFKLAIASNGTKKRFEKLKEQIKRENIDIQIHPFCKKPFPFKLANVIRSNNLKAKECVIVGDQIFTDIVVGNILGMKTIKVEPLSNRDMLHTKILRLLEKPIIKIAKAINKEKR